MGVLFVSYINNDLKIVIIIIPRTLYQERQIVDEIINVVLKFCFLFKKFFEYVVI